MKEGDDIYTTDLTIDKAKELLKVGAAYNYKELTSALNEKYLYGNSRISQLNYFNNYLFSYDKDGSKYIITGFKESSSDNVQLKKINIGNKYTYKELCSFLNIKYRTGNAKKTSIKEIRKYLDIEKIEGSYDYYVKQIYDKPLFSFKQLRNDSIYGKYIEYIIMKIIKDQIKNNNNYGYIANTTRWFEIIGMVNSNYSKSFKEREDENLIFFYNETYKKIYKILYNTLNNMVKRNLIGYERTFSININNDGYHLANESELAAIDIIEETASDMLGINRKYLWKGINTKYNNYAHIYNKSIEKYNEENTEEIITGIKKVLYIYATGDAEEHIDEIIKCMEEDLIKEFNGNISVNKVRHKINSIIINKFQRTFINKLKENTKIKSYSYKDDKLISIEDNSLADIFIKDYNNHIEIYEKIIEQYISLK